MEPTLKGGEYVLASSIPYLWASPQVGDIVIVKHPRENLELIKRVVKQRNRKYYVVGDNEEQSYDSKIFGWVDRTIILAKVILS